MWVASVPTTRMKPLGRLRSLLPRLRQRSSSAPELERKQLEAHPESWLAWIQTAKEPHAPLPSLMPLAADARISCCGCPWTEPTSHLWLARLPGSVLANRVVDHQASHPHRLQLKPSRSECGEAAVGLSRCTLNLELPPVEAAESWLHHMRDQQLIWDPDPGRVALMQALDLPAVWLDGQAPRNHWLEQRGATDPAAWAAHLGIAAPLSEALLVLGDAGEDWERALALEAESAHGLSPVIDYRPGWSWLVLESVETGLALAGWLDTASCRVQRVVLMGDVLIPEPLSLLDWPCSPWRMESPLLPDELRALHRGELLPAQAQERAAREVDVLFFSEGHQGPAAASVVVSLHNYADRISTTLDAVAAQTQSDLELVVVDDVSTDGGAEVVRLWMETRVAQGAHPFCRLQLLRHHSNGGLACARNTGFANATSPWCFVLDADNTLFPQAVERCLEQAQQGGAHLAVVYPLVAVRAESGSRDPRSLISPAPWHTSHFVKGNQIDAMALIRRQAWAEVGGFTHIEGGWEDFDFWCKLIDAGWHGLQVPAVLARYLSHGQSMTQTVTNRTWRALSATLQQRHPWLNLPLAPP